MPVYQVGDLVQVKDSDDDVIGIILEMRAMPHRRPDARVLWNDMPEPRWIQLSSVIPMEPVQPEQTVVQ